jgi:hypothetical protein
MKRVIRLTERDLTRIVKRVLMEQGDKITTQNFKDIPNYEGIASKPTKVYEQGDFITLNWNDPTQFGNNIITIVYRNGDNQFEVSLTDKSKGKYCGKIESAADFLQDIGGSTLGEYRDNGNTCGVRFKFEISKFDSIYKIINTLHSKLFKKL